MAGGDRCERSVPKTVNLGSAADSAPGARSYRRLIDERVKEGTMNTKRWLRGNVAVGLGALVAAATVWMVAGGTAGAQRAVPQQLSAAYAAVLVHDVADARAGTAKYVTNLALAK